MNRPTSIKHAVIVIWVNLLMDALVYVMQRQTGIISSGEFITSLMGVSVVSILPYKIYKGSNFSRYAYTVMTIFSYLFLVGEKNLNLVNFFLMAVEIFIIYKLFTKESSEWITQTK